MSDPRFTNPYATPSQTVIGPDGTIAARPDARTQAAFLTQAFLWMFVGLAVTAGVSFVVQSDTRLLDFAGENVLLLIIGQLVLAFAIQLGIRRMSATLALGLFFAYAASLGLTIGLIVSFYTTGSVATAFLSASAMFGAAAIYGHVTKRSLASLGGLLFMGVIGLLVASVINVFLVNNTISWIISIVGVVIFTALTAYDVQRIQNGDLAVWTGSTEKAAVLGALHLYLDFVNLFLFLLRLLGSRN
jgi:FtsH-binding integral membrane protein